MKQIILAGTLAIAIIWACKTKDKEHSKSYAFIKTFLLEAKIPETDIIYFYLTKPGNTFPNVYCFDSNGVQLDSPPQCFQYITEYVKELNKGRIQVKRSDTLLHHFLDNRAILDVNNQRINMNSLQGYQYYLFIDFIALPLPGLQETLFQAKQAVSSSNKKIRLFLVHAISEHNVQYFRKKRNASDSAATK